jgi:peroxiredoxin
MAIPKQGDPFPDFAIDGFDTRLARGGAPLLVVVWKSGCSTSRMALPFFDRLQNYYPGAKVVGVSQDAPDVLADYLSENGIHFQQFSDTGLAISRSLGVEFVPSFWLLDDKAAIVEAGGAWERDRMEAIGEELAARTGAEARMLVQESDNVPAFKPG